MAFNIDADPINANWLRWKNWDVPFLTVSELLVFLGVSDADRSTQVEQLSRLKPFFEQAPAALQEELKAFLET